MQQNYVGNLNFGPSRAGFDTDPLKKTPLEMGISAMSAAGWAQVMKSLNHGMGWVGKGP